MKKNNLIMLGAAALALVSFSGCSDDINFNTGDGEGKVLIRPLIQSNVEVVKRAATTDDEMASKAVIWISNPQGVVRKYQSMSEVPAGGIALMSDHYVAEVWSGDSVPASFTDRHFQGRENFTITKGQTVQVDIVCKIANTLAQVEYVDDVLDYLTDCSMTVGHKAGSLEFSGDNATKEGYFMMPSFDPNLTYTFTAKNTAGDVVKKEGVIANARKGTKYLLKVKHNGPESSEIGGGLFSIEVEESEVLVNETIEIQGAPQIKGLNFDIDQPVLGTQYSLTEKKLWITATAEFKTLTFECPGLSTLLGISGDGFELFGMNDAIRQQILAKGFSYQTFSHPDTGMAEVKITLENELMALFGNGEYPLTVTATDINGRSSQKIINIIVSDAKVMLEPLAADALTTFATHATIYGSVLKNDVESVGFNYRKAGSANWEFVEGVTPRALTEGATFWAELTNLTPGTTYEYQAVSDGVATGKTATLTTEGAPQLPNAGFEEWCIESKITYPASSTSNLYWDTGNTGAKLASAVLTSGGTEKKHSGTYSARLETKKAAVMGIGKLAAGNIFIGKYLKTDGTNGVLGWGRPFAGRPTALKGYVHYTPKTVTDESNSYAELKKGDLDKGIIYIALLDDTQSEAEGYSFPFICKTNPKNLQLFDKNASQVIAYGELVFTEETAGSDMVEFTIPLDYKRTDVRPSNIMVVCAASKGGDYFVGGEGSLMYLDDFELVY